MFGGVQGVGKIDFSCIHSIWKAELVYKPKTVNMLVDNTILMLGAYVQVRNLMKENLIYSVIQKIDGNLKNIQDLGNQLGIDVNVLKQKGYCECFDSNRSSRNGNF